jgi:hypothetical protein
VPFRSPSTPELLDPFMRPSLSKYTAASEVSPRTKGARRCTNP